MFREMKFKALKIVHHTIYPAIMSVLFFTNVAIPKTVLGCANRGLVAIAIAFISVIAALITVIIALKKRFSGNPESLLWVISTLILIVPVIALIVLG